jgi:hypothetical protein
MPKKILCLILGSGLRGAVHAAGQEEQPRQLRLLLVCLRASPPVVSCLPANAALADPANDPVGVNLLSPLLRIGDLGSGRGSVLRRELSTIFQVLPDVPSSHV